jgi:hypothetical protein
MLKQQITYGMKFFYVGLGITLGFGVIFGLLSLVLALKYKKDLMVCLE